MKKTKYAILFLFLSLSAAFIANKIYVHFFFDIEKYIISEKFRGDIERYKEALKSGKTRFQYCGNYVRLYQEYDSEFSDSYYTRSGRLSYRYGQIMYGSPPPKGLSCSENCPSLECAVKYNEVNSVKKLIKNGEAPNTLHTRGSVRGSVLMGAAYGKKYEIAQILLENGANANFKNELGQTSLHILSRGVSQGIYKGEEYKEIFDLLLKHGADINTQQNSGSTPLHSLTHWTRKPLETAFFEELLKAGANPNIQGYDGQTVLTKFLLDNLPSRYPLNKKIIKLLLDYGANPNIKNNNGKSAIDIAREQKLDDIVELLKNYKQKLPAQ